MRSEHAAAGEHPASVQTTSLFTVLALCAGVAVLGAFAIYLNKLFYRTHGPFYDSLTYMNAMAEIMRRARQDGFLAALRAGANNSSVFLPWLESAVLGLVASPSRIQGVLLQLPLAAAQVAAAYAFFRRVASYPQLPAAVFALVTVSFASVFFFNGGLSDLRMDLAQALTFGTAAAVLCLARATGRRRHWVLLGVALGVAFLVRATTPVYAVLLLGTTAAVDLLRADGSRGRRLVDYLLAGAIAAVLSGWFYLLNLAVLLDYYTVRNFDAMARLPLSESVKHLDFVARMHLGLPFCALAAGALIVEVVARRRRGQSLLRDLNWPMLLAGALPAGFLVLFGTSPGNPFVSMASAPGLLMFALAPYASAVPVRWSQLRLRVFVLAACAAVVLNAWTGVRSHLDNTNPWTPAAVPLQQLTRSIDRDLAARGKKEGTFEVTYVGSLDSLVLLNSFVFDQGFEPAGGGLSAIKNGVRLTAVAPPLANPADWRGLAGATDADRVTTLVTQARAEADYLVVPENGNTFVGHHPITPHALVFRDRILAGGGMTRIAGPLRVSGHEQVSVYRNDNRR